MPKSDIVVDMGDGLGGIYAKFGKIAVAAIVALLLLSIAFVQVGPGQRGVLPMIGSLTPGKGE